MRIALAAFAVLVVASCANSVDTAPPVDGAVNPTAGDALSMPACGTALSSFDGTVAYSNGANTGTGVSCNGVGEFGYEYQCVELVMRHFKTHWDLHWYGNAKDLLDNAPRDRVDVVANGDSSEPPVPGDMVVWPNGAYGHVALVTAVHDGGIDVIEQNVSGPGSATLPWDGATIGARWGTWIPSGWAHAKDNVVTPPDPPPPDPTPTDPTPTDPSTSTGNESGVAWSCAQSSYGGGQFWTCSGGDAYRCDGATPVSAGCAAGCYSRSLGEDDVCIDDDASWSCSDSAYGGGQFWTCAADGAIHKCDAGGTALKVQCPAGCVVHALGVDDSCG